MSAWYEAEDVDINVNHRDKSVDVLVTENDLGNIYVTLSFEQIKSCYMDIVTIGIVDD